MATLTPQQEQQFQQILNQVSQQVKNLQNQVGTLAAAKSAGMTITPQTSVEQAAAYLASAKPSTSSSETSKTMSALSSASSAPLSYQNYTIQKGDTLSSIANKYGTTIQSLLAANPQITNPNLIYAGSVLKIPTTTSSPQTQNVQNIQSNQNNQNVQIPQVNQLPDWQTAFTQLLNQYQALTQKYANPPTPDTSNISNIYSKTAADLTARYQKLLDDLKKKQQEDQQRLIGRYAAAGFSEPGILGGSQAGIPGIATKGLEELQSQQVSDITNLQQAAAGDLNALAAAQASAEQQAQQQAIDNYYKQLQLMQNALTGQYSLINELQPQTYQIGGRVYQKDPMTGTFTNVTPPEVEEQLQKEEQQKGISAPFSDDQGNVWVYDANQQKLIKVGKTAPKQSNLQVITDKITGEPIYIFDKTTGDIIPLGGNSSPFSTPSTSTPQTAPPSGFLPNLPHLHLPDIWNKIKSFLQGY